MNGITLKPLAEARPTEITRFNALRHGVLSRYTGLPWEDAEEYSTLVAALVAEHTPQGPTEEHLVEELAGILWRKRRLRLPTGAGWRARWRLTTRRSRRRWRMWALKPVRGHN